MLKKVRGSKDHGSKTSPECAEVKRLEVEFYEGPENANNIVDLMIYTSNDDASVCMGAFESLHRIFLHLMSEGLLTKVGAKKAKSINGDVKKSSRDVYEEWLQDQRKTYIRALLALVCHETTSKQVAGLQMCMQLVELEAQKLTQTKNHVFPNAFFLRVLDAMVCSDNCSDALVKAFTKGFLLKYDDVRYYTLKNLTAIMKKLEDAGEPESVAMVTSRRIFSIIAPILFPTVVEELDCFLSPLAGQAPKSDNEAISESKNTKRKATSNDEEGGDEKSLNLTELGPHKKVFTNCWRALLRRALPLDVYKRILMRLHTDIMPHLTNPRLLIDFLTNAYDQGGVVSVLALDGLFVLMTQHNLDYPDFFVKLWQMFDHEIFLVKHRDRFLTLADTCLGSPLLPSYLVGAFLKRLARLALRAPPSGCAYVMPLMYNLLLRHPQCMAMIHRERSDGVDVYVEDAKDPKDCNAIESSLWELDALMMHQVPSVAKFAEVFESVFTKSNFKVTDFLDSDSAMIKDELKIRVKTDVPLQYQHPTGLIGEGENNSVLAKGWVL
eukprot:CFRG2675T1